MKKIIAFVLLLLFCLICSEVYAAANTVSIVKNTSEGIIFEVSCESYTFLDVDHSNYKRLHADGFVTIDRSGYPGVLVKGVMLDVPSSCSLSVSADSAEVITHNNFLLAPSPQKGITEKEGIPIITEKFEPDTAAYSAGGCFPGKLADFDFTGYFRGERVSRIRVYPVQYNPVTRELTVHKRLTVAVTYNCKDVNAPELLINNNKKYKIYNNIYSNILLNYNKHTSYVHTPRVKKNISSPHFSWYGELQESPFAVKAVIESEGVYKITYTDLKVLGINLTASTSENIKIINQGKEVAVYCSGTGPLKSGDFFVFYGKPFKSLYSKKNVYWIYQGKQNGERMQTINSGPVSAYPLQTSYKIGKHEEKDLIYWSNIPPYSGDIDHFLWEKLSIIDPPLSKEFILSLGSVNKASGPFSLKTCLKGQTNTGQNPDHHTKIYINDTIIDDFTWDGQNEEIRDTLNIPAEYFTDGDNSLSVEAVDDLGVTVDSYYINWFELNYSGNYIAYNNMLKFTNNDTGGIQFLIKGFSGNSIYCFDITEPENALLVTGMEIKQSGSGYSVNFEAVVSDNRTYYAVEADDFKSPDELIVDTSSNLQSPRDDIDYIIVTHEKLYDTVQELKQYRAAKGFNIEIVQMQDVYDEFSYGIKDINALKSFLTYAYTNWNSNDHPAYVLLVGDASVDYRDDLGKYAEGKEDLVPTFLYETNPFGHTPTDNWFVCVDGDDYLPDMIIGRISVKTDTDLQNVIIKIKEYETTEPGEWCGNVIFAADNEATFENISNTLAVMLPDGFNAERVFISDYDDITDATNDLLEKINGGAIITNYTGHGNVDVWAAEALLHTADDDDNQPRNDVDKLTNGNKLTFLMALDCLNGYFPSRGDDYSLAEEFVRSENKGAIASFAPTSLGYPSEHLILSKNIFDDYFNNKITVVGDLVTTAKINTYNQINSRDIIETFTLFGDPATELKLITSEDLLSFNSKGPSDNDTLPVLPIYTFSWGSGLYERFKLQYSYDPAFLPDTTITVPLFPLLFLSKTTYTPNIFIWTLLRMMTNRNGTIYWRVVAYDEFFNQIAFTDENSFAILK